MKVEHVIAATLLWASLGIVAIDADAGDISLPSDISVGLSASPTSNLEPGDRITFTISVTNEGPYPVAQLAIGSSAIYNELDVYSASADCEGDIILSVVDLGNGFYYIYTYYPTQDSGLEVGETRTCALSIDYTPWAPPTFPVTFALASFESDLNPSNDSATVLLRRVSAATPIPTLGTYSLGFLIFLIIFFASSRTSRFRSQ